MQHGEDFSVALLTAPLSPELETRAKARARRMAELQRVRGNATDSNGFPSVMLFRLL